MIPRIFVQIDPKIGEVQPIPAATIHYLTRTLRMRGGEMVRVFSGGQGEWQAILEKQPQGFGVRLQTFEPVVRESPLRITLVQGLAKASAMEWVVQKGVELGVDTIIPLLCRRSVSRLAGETEGAKIQRWQKIALEATEQCGRTQLLHLAMPVSWDKLAQVLPHGPRLLFWENNNINNSLMQIVDTLPSFDGITLLVGPEGGLEAEEVTMACSRWGFISLGLGPRILRTETAAITVIAALQMLRGDLSCSPPTGSVIL